MYFSSFCNIDFFSVYISMQISGLFCVKLSAGHSELFWFVWLKGVHLWLKKGSDKTNIFICHAKIFRYNSAVFSLASKVFSFDHNQMFKYDLKVFSSDSEMFWDDSEVFIAEFEVFSGCLHVQICKLIFLISFFRISADILCSSSDTLCWHLCYLFPEPAALSILLHVQGSNHAGNEPRQSTFHYFESCRLHYLHVQE